MSKLHRYEDQEGVVTYDAQRCIHAAECVRGLPTVFDPNGRPWVNPDGAGADEVAAVVARCPTGALHFERKDGLPAEAVPAENRVRLVEDGPLYVHGRIEIASQDGTVQLTDTRVALCRCGASMNKPFCDGSHTRAGFRASGAWAELMAQTGASTDGGPLRVVGLTNGPLLLQGPFTLSAADGTSARCTRAAALLRRKPFAHRLHGQIKEERLTLPGHLTGPRRSASGILEEVLARGCKSAMPEVILPMNVMVTSVRIPKPLLEAVDRKARALKVSRDRLIVQALKRELAPGADWSPGFFEQLHEVDSETVAAVDELLASVRQARTSKPPRPL